MKQIKHYALISFVLWVFVASCSRYGNKGEFSENLPNAVVLEWNEIAYDAFGGAAYQHSLMASRINAMMHIAMHDAVNAVKQKYQPYAFTGSDSEADAITAAAAAAHAVLLNEIPLRKGFLDSAFQKTLGSVAENDARKKGVRLGQLAAQAIIDSRANDGSAREVIGKIPLSTVPGVYQVVPPFDFVFAPHWENVKLFGLKKKDQFRCAPHPSLNSSAYADAFNEVKEIGKINSTVRTADQTFYARFWYEFSEAGWNRIARVVAADKKLNLHETARLFALVDMALADAYTAGWDSKFNYNFWRPYTAIKAEIGIDRNIKTPDAAWEPLMPTPPVQDYPSTHSALGNAAAAVLSNILGDNTSFTFTSPTAVPAGSSRSFSSFSEAANENADSRVMAGIHFRFSCVAGQQLGTQIGNWIAGNYLKQVK